MADTQINSVRWDLNGTLKVNVVGFFSPPGKSEDIFDPQKGRIEIEKAKLDRQHYI